MGRSLKGDIIYGQSKHNYGVTVAEIYLEEFFKDEWFQGLGRILAGTTVSPNSKGDSIFLLAISAITPSFLKYRSRLKWSIISISTNVLYLILSALFPRKYSKYIYLKYWCLVRAFIMQILNISRNNSIYLQDLLNLVGAVTGNSVRC